MKCKWHRAAVRALSVAATHTGTLQPLHPSNTSTPNHEMRAPRALPSLCKHAQSAPAPPVLLCAHHGLVKLQELAQGMAARQLRPTQHSPQPLLKLATPPAGMGVQRTRLQWLRHKDTLLLPLCMQQDPAHMSSKA